MKNFSMSLLLYTDAGHKAKSSSQEGGVIINPNPKAMFLFVFYLLSFIL